MQELLNGLLGVAGDFLAAYDANANMVYANARAFELTEYTPEEIGACLEPEHMHDEATACRVRNCMRRALSAGFARLDATLITKNGTQIPVRQQYFAIRDKHGSVLGGGLVVQVGAACDAAGMLDVLKSILDQLDASVYVSDMQTHELLFVNKQTRETFHIDENQSENICYKVIQKGMTERCPFCPINKLEQDPDTPIVWEKENSLNGRWYRNMDSVIEWTDGRKVHLEYTVDITDIKRMQLEADNSLSVLKNILNGMAAYIYVSDLYSDEVLFVNNRMQEAFGLDETAVGKTCWKIFQAGFHERCSFCPSNKLAIDQSTPVVWEEHNTITGRWYRNVDSVIEWLDGKMVHMQHSTDITDIMLAQQENARIYERLELALIASQTGVWEIDFATDTLTYDDWSGKLLGFRPDENTIRVSALLTHLQSAHARFLVNGEVVPLELREATLATGGLSGDLRLKFPNQDALYVRIFSNTIRDADGEPQRVIGTCIDITKSVDMETALKAAKVAAELRGRAEVDERTQTMLDATPLAASFWDARGNILDCNMESVRMFELNNKEEFIEHYYDFNPKFQPDGVGTAEKVLIETARAFEEGTRRFEWMYRTKSGEPLPVETTLVRVPWKGEYRLAAYSRDLREIRAAEQQRQEAVERSLEMEVQARTATAASKAKSQFLSNMSHEIRTPMNAITGMAELLTHEKLTDRQRSYVKDIQTSSTSLLSIINDILDFSKIEAGRLQLNPTDYNIQELLRNVESMFLFAAQQKGLTFRLDVKRTLPTCLFGDDIRLRQALINILGNAIKFTKHGGVVFGVDIDGDMLCLDIADTGIGIRKEEISKIFNEFAQADNSNNRAIMGTGLGLSITQSLISMMEGTLTLESEYGKGSVFHIRVPLVLGNAQALGATKAASGPRVYAPTANILVVDDNEVNINVASGMLRFYGIVCDTAMSGAEAIRKVGAQAYDIVFMDHMMPEMDGIETTRRLREQYADGSLVIIALTANAIEGVRDTLLIAGMNDYLSKPIDIMELDMILRNWLPPDKMMFAQADVPEEGQPMCRTLAQAMSIDALDVQLGLARLSGMQDAYEQTLRIFTRRLPEAMQRLSAFLAQGDLNGFSIEVHGLKGSLNSVGAIEIGEVAGALEHAAKQADGAYCTAHLPTLLASLGALHTALAAIFSDDGEAHPKEAGDSGLLRITLPLLRDLLDVFEGDEAISKLNELVGYDYGEELNAKLKAVHILIEEFEYDKAIALIDTVLKEGGSL